MSGHIKKIRTLDGDKQIDYKFLANLPPELPAEPDDDGNIVCENGLKVHGDFSCKGYSTGYDDSIPEEELSEENDYGYIYNKISGPLTMRGKVGEFNCHLTGYQDSVEFQIDGAYDADYIQSVFPAESYDYELSPGENITEDQYDLFCGAKLVETSDGKLKTLNTEHIAMDSDAFCVMIEEIPVKVAVFTKSTGGVIS